MNLKPAAVVAALALSLAACGGGGESPASPDAAPASDATGGGGSLPEGATHEEGGGMGPGKGAGLETPVGEGESFTYPDGLRVEVGNWRVVDYGGNPDRMAKVDVTVTNSTDEPITTTQAWLSVRAGDAGRVLEEWAEGESVDAVLQPGAEATGTYSFTEPESSGHVVATVQWHEAEGDENRYDVMFDVED